MSAAMSDPSTPPDSARILRAADEMRALIARQAALFAEGRIEEAAALTEAAGHWALMLGRDSQALAAHPPDPATAAQWRPALAALREALDAHMQILARGRALSEGLLKALADHAMDSQPAPAAYGPSGARRNPAGALAMDKSA